MRTFSRWARGRLQTTLLVGTDGAVSQGMEVGLFVLGSPRMEEAVYVGYDGASVFVDMRNSSQNTTLFQSSFRTSNIAPFPKPASGVIQLHVRRRLFVGKGIHLTDGCLTAWQGNSPL